MRTANEVLQMHVLNLGTITRQRVAELTGYNQSTVSKWLNNVHVMSYEAVSALMANGPKALSDDLRAVTYVPPRAVDEADMDFNRDGVVDMDDLLDAKAQYSLLAGEDAHATRAETSDGVLTTDEHLSQLSRVNSMQRLNRTILGIAAKVASKGSEIRRKARQLSA